MPKDFFNKVIDLYHDLKTEIISFADVSISFEEKEFYDTIKSQSAMMLTTNFHK